jgi:glycosyltransferase involved in cell wall biosynthesis
MKILWLSHLVPYPPKGGVLQRSYHLLHQVSLYHEVDLLAFNQKDLMAPLVQDLDQGIKDAHKHLSSFCQRVEFFDIPSDKSNLSKKGLAFKSLFTEYPYTLNWLLSEKFNQRIKELVETEGYDFIHFDTISLAPFKSVCGDVHTSLDHHNIESHMLFRRAEKESNLLKRWYFIQEGKRLEKFEKIYCPQFSFNFTCSDVDTDRLRSISPSSQVHTIPNGVDVNYFNPEPEDIKVNSLLFVGTLSWYPNIEAVNFIAKEIWPLLKSISPKLTFDIIGANPPDSIKLLAEKDPNFHVHGFVDDIIPYFKRAKCYVCPIKDGGGTKLKIIDALSMGMAIVADPIACEGINVKNNVSVLFAETANEYIKSIKLILEQDALREDLQKNARKLAVDSYSYNKIGLKLTSLFNKYRS